MRRQPLRSAPSVRKSVWLAGMLIALIGGGAIGFVASEVSSSRGLSEARDRVLGQPLPRVALLGLSGQWESLEARLAGAPGFIVIAGMRDCWACSDYPRQLRVLRERSGLRTLLVGSGADTAGFREYFRLHRLNEIGLLDPAGDLVRRLGIGSEPWALLVDGSGRVLFADGRNASSAAQMPVATLLAEAADILNCRGSCLGR